MKLSRISVTLMLFFISLPSYSQTINADLHDSNIVFTSGTSNVNFYADFGIDSNEFLDGLQGITFNIGFDPTAIYADSLHIKANSHLLGLHPSEYMEMQRVDSNYALYSIVLKGREKTLNMSTLPLMFNFRIRPEVSQKLVENDCNYQIYFSAANLKAQDSKQAALEIEPFDFSIDIDCEALRESRTLTASPNPTKGKVWINTPFDFINSVEQVLVHDMKGVMVSAKTREYDNIIEVDLSSFKEGVYLITITYDKWEKDVLKIIKN
ncbi:T9SS type A sorting domain-containing protein [Ancylomarina sp. YFZ004]